MTPQFPETYLRNYIDDEGQCEASDGFSLIVDTFNIIVAGSYQLLLSQAPSAVFQAFVYLNNKLQYIDEIYTINSRNITFPMSLLQIGDTVICKYWIVRP